MKEKISKYLGIFLSLLVLSLVIAKNFLLPTDSETEMDEIFQEVIFDDSTSKIIPEFFHQDNSAYYEGWKVQAFRSLFFAPGVAVGDINNDGFTDFVVTSSKSEELPKIYLNSGGWNFNAVDLIDKKDLPSHDLFDSNISPFLADFDNDGNLDLFITSLKCTKFFLNKNQKFYYQKDHKFSNLCDGSTSALPYDFDHDGKLDLLLIRYWSKKWQQIFEQKSQERFIEEITDFFENDNVVLKGANGGTSVIYFANGKESSLNEENNVSWSFDATVSDLDEDGVDELIIANDFGNDRIYHIKNYELSDVTSDFKFSDRRNGMSASINYLPNNSLPFLYISNIWIENYLEKGNFYWHYDKNKKALIEESEDVGLNNAKWAWGSAFGDFNIDGFNDVYIANGYIKSNGERKEDREGRFRSAYYSSLPKPSSIKKFFTSKKEKKDETQTIFEIFLNAAGVAQKDSLRIYSPITKRFLEAKKDKNLDYEWDGRAVAKIDFDNDGDLDLLVSSQNDRLRLLRNTTNEKYHKKNWVGFDVENQQFLRKIILNQDGNKYYQDWNNGRSGFLATSDSRIYFTLKNKNDVEVEFILLDGRVVKKKFSSAQYHKLKL